ncbi:MAG: glycoside hydrolase family 127 protein [Victivallales bacterium]|nr:glycoside hydrolase family 127 protein [Victivallales bacterium]
MKSRPISLKEVKLRDGWLSRLVELGAKVVVPYSLERCEETGRIDALRGLWKPGMPKEPHVFWDSDVAKVIEGLALEQVAEPTPERARQLEEYVDIILSQQQPDGYLNSHYVFVEPDKRWSNIEQKHELYCAGHLIEAAVAHFQATGTRKFLDGMCRYADYIATVFGLGEGQLRGYPGHEELELALCKLADATGEQKYAELAKYFVDERGQQPSFFEEEARRTGRDRGFLYRDGRQFQAHKPVREQEKPVGHAVRAMYLYSGMADVAERFEDAELLAACERLFDATVNANMYVTGGIGSSREGERFTTDYDLPNSTAYAESCASIALALFAMRMMNITGDAKYADALETELFNGAVSGLSLEGDRFFYANRLESLLPYGLMSDSQAFKRQGWFGCSCCPTNYCRFLPQLPAMAYSELTDGIAANIPVDAELSHAGLSVCVTGNYPFGDSARLEVQKDCASGTLALRIPGWAEGAHVLLNGSDVTSQAVRGYVRLTRAWQAGDVLELRWTKKVRCLHADVRVAEDVGKIALALGPVIFALESVDNEGPLSAYILPEVQEFRIGEANGLPAGTPAITGRAFVESNASAGLYTTQRPSRKESTFTAIPYALWQNRGESTMTVWVRYC